MPTLSLLKTIEARKLNQRTGFPESGPEITIPFGALVEHVSSDRDTDRFNYLGEPYRCKHDLWLSATGEKDQPDHRAATPVEPPQQAAPPKVQWEELSSSRKGMFRAKVAGGWMIALEGCGLAFYPDPEHQWDGTSLS